MNSKETLGSKMVKAARGIMVSGLAIGIIGLIDLQAHRRDEINIYNNDDYPTIQMAEKIKSLRTAEKIAISEMFAGGFLGLLASLSSLYLERRK